MGAHGETPTVKTSERSLDVLVAIQQLDGARVTDLASHLDVPKGTVYKHLTTLEQREFLTREGDHYHLGLKFLNMGEYARMRSPTFEPVEEAINELGAKSGEEVDFMVEDHGRVITISEAYHEQNRYIDQLAEENRNIQSRDHRAHIGAYYYMHSTAAGKALLAEKSETEIDAILDEWGLPRRSEFTITIRDELFENLKTVRERGYAITDQEFTEGLRGVAQVVENPDESIVGAISIYGPTYRLSGEHLEERLPSLLDEQVAKLERMIASLEASERSDSEP